MSEIGFDLDSLQSMGKKKLAGAGPKTEKLEKDKTVQYRILPANNPVSRDLAKMFVTHWITTEQGRKQQVLCTYYTERSCALCKKHKEFEELLKKAKEAGAAPQEIKDLEDAEYFYRTDRFVIYAAMNKAGEPIYLNLKKTVADALNEKIVEAVQTRGFDPTSPTNGVWFQFKKVGNGRDSVTVDFARIFMDMNGESVEKLDRTPLTQEQIAMLAEKTPNIHDLNALWIKHYSAADIANFVATGQPIPFSANLAKKDQPTNSFMAAQPAASAVQNTFPHAAAAPVMAPAQQPVASALVQSEPAAAPAMAQAQPNVIQAPVSQAPAQTTVAPPKPATSSMPSATALEIARIREQMAKAKAAAAQAQSK